MITTNIFVNIFMNFYSDYEYSDYEFIYKIYETYT